MSCEHTGRQQGDDLQAKEGQQTMKLGVMGQILPQNPQKELTLLTFDLVLRDYDIINFCCLNHLICCTLFWQT